MRALLLVGLVLAAPLAAAYPDPGAVPAYFPSDCYERYTKRFVHDYLGIVPEDYGVAMEEAACEIYAQTSAHYVLVTTSDTEGESLENYALHLFEEWGIGERARHDGILMLFVDDYLGSGESALRIEVGYGLEGVVDSQVTEEAWGLMLDARDRALDAGEDARSARVYAMAMGTAYLLTVIRDGYTDGGFPPPDPASAADASGGAARFWFNVLIIVLVIVVILALAQRRRGWGYHGPSSPAWSSGPARVWIPPPSTGGGSFGGGRSGGGTFGGGRSGGGGRGGKF